MHGHVYLYSVCAQCVYIPAVCMCSSYHALDPFINWENKIIPSIIKILCAKNVNIVLSVIYLYTSNHAAIKHNMNCALFVALFLIFLEEETHCDNYIVHTVHKLVFVFHLICLCHSVLLDQSILDYIFGQSLTDITVCHSVTGNLSVNFSISENWHCFCSHF